MSLLNNLLALRYLRKSCEKLANRWPIFSTAKTMKERVLASFVEGLLGTPGKQVSYAGPRHIG